MVDNTARYWAKIPYLCFPKSANKMFLLVPMLKTVSYLAVESEVFDMLSLHFFVLTPKINI